MHSIVHPLLAATPGTQRTLTSLHFGAPGGPKALVQAALHADELPGMLVVQHLRMALAALEAEGRVLGEVVLLPVANPIGLAQWLQGSPHGRFDFASGENFNRHYAELGATVAERVTGRLGADAAANVAQVRAALREAVAALPAATELQSLRRALLALAVDADVVLDLHGDDESVLHVYTGTPLWPQAEPLVRLLGAELVLLASRSGDEPFDEACSQVWWELAQRFGAAHPLPPACLAATVELRGEADVDHAFAARDAQALLQFLAYRGLLDLERITLPPLRRDARPLAGTVPLLAPAGGLLVFVKAPGDEVRRGDAVAELIDPASGETQTLASPIDGLLFARTRRRFVPAGLRVAKVAGVEPVRSGKLLGV